MCLFSNKRKLSNLLDQPSMPLTNIPWIETEHIKKSRSMLNGMYNFLSEDLPLKIFIKENCLHLLQEPKNDTGYSVDYFKKENFLSKPDIIHLPKSYSNNILSNLEGTAGVYTFFSLETNKFYIGATTNLPFRLINHYSLSDSVLN